MVARVFLVGVVAGALAGALLLFNLRPPASSTAPPEDPWAGACTISADRFAVPDDEHQRWLLLGTWSSTVDELKLDLDGYFSAYERRGGYFADGRYLYFREAFDGVGYHRNSLTRFQYRIEGDVLTIWNRCEEWRFHWSRD
jgi:hypothetical protein